MVGGWREWCAAARVVGSDEWCAMAAGERQRLVNAGAKCRRRLASDATTTHSDPRIAGRGATIGGSRCYFVHLRVQPSRQNGAELTAIAIKKSVSKRVALERQRKPTMNEGIAKL